MSTLAVTLLSGIGAALIWGGNSFIESIIAPHYKASVLLAWDTLWGALTILGLALLGVKWWDLDAEVWAWIVASGLFRIVAWFAYWKVLSDRSSSLAVAITATYSLPAVLILALMGQSLSVLVLLACLAIFTGMLVSGARQKLAGNQLLWALFSCLIWGGWAACQWKAAQASHPLQLLGASWLCTMLLSSIVAARLRARDTDLRLARPDALRLGFSWLIGALSTTLLYWGLKEGSGDQVIVISSAYPLVLLALRLATRKESWSARVGVGVLLLTCGAALASLA